MHSYYLQPLLSLLYVFFKRGRKFFILIFYFNYFNIFFILIYFYLNIFFILTYIEFNVLFILMYFLLYIYITLKYIFYFNICTVVVVQNKKL
jgi:hypothetical protein